LSPVLSQVIKSITSWRIFVLLKRTIQEFTVDNCPLLAASVSYYLLLSIFPFLLGLISLSSFFVDESALQEQIFQAFKYLVPISPDFLSNITNSVIAGREATGIIAVILLFVGCLGFFNALRRALNTAWGVYKSGSFIRMHLTNFVMVLAAVLLLFMSRFMTIILTVSENMLTKTIEQPEAHSALSRLLALIIGVTVAFIIFLISYKYIPERRIRWRDIWLSALLGAICFEIINRFFMLYLDTFNPYSLIYGSLGAIIAMLIWTYLFAFIFLFFAKIAAVNLKIKDEQLQQ